MHYPKKQVSVAEPAAKPNDFLQWIKGLRPQNPNQVSSLIVFHAAVYDQHINLLSEVPDPSYDKRQPMIALWRPPHVIPTTTRRHPATTIGIDLKLLENLIDRPGESQWLCIPSQAGATSLAGHIKTSSINPRTLESLLCPSYQRSCGNKLSIAPSTRIDHPGIVDLMGGWYLSLRLRSFRATAMDFFRGLPDDLHMIPSDFKDARDKHG
ncbi:MAG: hypothetical protein Q9203_005232 [Teloschistes exilis]